jgi:hypothetical protein
MRKSVKKEGELVISKNEITNLSDYHKNIKKVGVKIADYAIALFPGNLLSSKIACREAVQEIERRLRENVN